MKLHIYLWKYCEMLDDAQGKSPEQIQGELRQFLGDEEITSNSTDETFSEREAKSIFGRNEDKLWQEHDATEQPDWTPDQAVSLWDICHTTDPAKATPYAAPQGTRGMYQEDECCTEEGHVWKCTQANTVYPPSQLPDSWTDLGTVEEVQG